MFKFLPPQIRAALKGVNYKNLNEIRLRANRPVTVGIGGNYKYLSSYGVSDNLNAALKLSQNEIEQIVLTASEYSIYTVNNQISRGYLTVDGGVRIGLAGEYVMQNSQVLTIKNISSLNVRVPHEIIGCGQAVFDLCLKSNLANVIIVSPPGMGKTTMLRDLARLISNSYKNNILIVDERGEIAPENCGFDLGTSTDIVRYSNKITAFEYVIRSMRPDIIITDELASMRDTKAAIHAANSGVKVLASCHLKDAKAVAYSEELKELFLQRAFDFYVQLSASSIGQIDFIFDESLDIIYGRN